MGLFTKKPEPPPPPPPPRKAEILMVGPPESGKTALLAALQYAALKQQTYHAGLNCTVSSANEAMQELFQDFMDISITGRFRPDATTGFVLYELQLVLQGLTPEGKQKQLPPPRDIHISIPDYPGYATDRAVAKASQEQAIEQMEIARREVIKRLPAVSGLIICLPEDGNTGPLSKRYLLDMVNILSAIQGNLQLSYVVFALTKLDAHAERGTILYTRGREVRAEVADRTTREHLERRLGAHGVDLVFLNAIRIKAPRVRFAAGRTSIFGFTSEGRFNYDPDWEGLLIRPEESLKEAESARNHRSTGQAPAAPLYDIHTVDSEWHPYHILDPFLFAAEGKVLDYESGANEIARDGDGFIPIFY